MQHVLEHLFPRLSLIDPKRKVKVTNAPLSQAGMGHLPCTAFEGRRPDTLVIESPRHAFHDHLLKLSLPYN